MSLEDILLRAKKVALADVNYGPRFRDVPFLDEESAKGLLQAGDLVIEYVPQVVRDLLNYHEYVLKGCMHIATVVDFAGKHLYKIEVYLKGIFCDRCIFSDISHHDFELKRFRMVIRSKTVAKDEVLRRSLNKSALTIAGFEDRDGTPLRVRDVDTNLFMHTHKLDGPLPKGLYCSELTYLAYKANHIDVCELCPIVDLIEASGGIPNRKITHAISLRYASGVKRRAIAYDCLIEWERLMRLLRLPILRPSRFSFRDAAWPHLILENPEFDILAVVPAGERYVRDYEKAMEEAKRSSLNNIQKY